MKKWSSINKSYVLLILCLSIPSMIFNAISDPATKNELILHVQPPLAPEKIKAPPATSDDEISKRLESILQATSWFTNPRVEVKNGVVFLTGETHNRKFKEWAEALAHNTQDVTAVVNNLAVIEPSFFDLELIINEFINQGKKILGTLPGIVLGAIILFLAWLAARLVYRLAPILLQNKMNPSLLKEVVARAIAFAVFLMGVYFVFEMADLTTMALTVISGTGLLGIILGIAFRDLAENFLASILLSLQNPFHTNDLIDLVCPTSGFAVTGYVERLTLRATILVSLEGNHVQIPNATVYKSNIINHSSNPNHRETFSVSVNQNCSLSKAVDSVLKILTENEAILKNPEPLVLVEALEKENVKLQICYWIDIKKYDSTKIKSSIMRMIKHVFQTDDIYQVANGLSERLSMSDSRKSIKNYEAKTTKSEVKKSGDAPLEKIKGISPQARLPEEENLLDKKSKIEKPTPNAK